MELKATFEEAMRWDETRCGEREKCDGANVIVDVRKHRGAVAAPGPSHTSHSLWPCSGMPPYDTG